MRKKLVVVAASTAALAGVTAGVSLAQGGDAPASPTVRAAQGPDGGSMNGMGAMGRAMSGRLTATDVTGMTRGMGMGMKLDPASVEQMVRAHNGAMAGKGGMASAGDAAMMRRR